MRTIVMTAVIYEDMLADDVTYDSFWVLDQIKSKAKYLEYLKHKLIAMQKSNKKTHYVMADKKTIIKVNTVSDQVSDQPSDQVNRLSDQPSDQADPQMKMILDYCNEARSGRI